MRKARGRLSGRGAILRRNTSHFAPMKDWWSAPVVSSAVRRLDILFIVREC